MPHLEWKLDNSKSKISVSKPKFARFLHYQCAGRSLRDLKVVSSASVAALSGLRKVQSARRWPWKSVARQYPPSRTPTQPTPAADATVLGKK